jgi:hypothetical protein
LKNGSNRKCKKSMLKRLRKTPLITELLFYQILANCK